jgi:Tol biopolymer transport system component
MNPPKKIYGLLLLLLLGLASCIGDANLTTAPVMPSATITQLIPSLTPTPSSASTEDFIVTSTVTSPPSPRMAVLAVENPIGYSLPADLFVLTLGKLDDVIRITTNNAAVDHVSWSPDGKKLAFSAADMGGDSFDIYTVNADGSQLNRIDPGLKIDAAEFEPSWSPDGKKIIFSQINRVYIMDADGSNAYFVTEGSYPSWSPDGRLIVFVRRYEQNLFGDIFTLDMTSNTYRQLTHNFYANAPAWSPDGNRIAFYGYDESGENAGLFVMDAGGSNMIRLTENTAEPSWSRDGKRILFADSKRLYEANVDGSGIKMVVASPENYAYIYAVWQP